MVIGSWHGPRAADHSRYERREKEREGLFQNMMLAALKILKEMPGNSYDMLGQPSFRILSYGVTSC